MNPSVTTQYRMTNLVVVQAMVGVVEFEGVTGGGMFWVMAVAKVVAVVQVARQKITKNKL